MRMNAIIAIIKINNLGIIGHIWLNISLKGQDNKIMNKITKIARIMEIIITRL